MSLRDIGMPSPFEDLKELQAELTKEREKVRVAREALVKIKDYFCACSDEGEIIPQVVAHEALKTLGGDE